MPVQFDYLKPYKPRFGMKPPRGVEGDDDPFGPEERAIDDILAGLGDTPEDRAERSKQLARRSALRAAREDRKWQAEDRKQKAEDRERARAPKFQFEDRPVEGGPGVGASIGRYRLKTDPNTGAVLDESFVDYFPDLPGRKAERAEARGEARYQERRTREDAYRQQDIGRSDYRFAYETGQDAKRAAEREQDRTDTLARQARADEAERYRLREYYDRLAQGANAEAGQRRQAEANRQEQARFAEEGRVQRQGMLHKYSVQLEQLMREPARFWASVGSNPAALEKLAAQFEEFNNDGRYDRIIAFLNAGPEQQRQPTLAAPRFGGRA